MPFTVWQDVVAHLKALASPSAEQMHLIDRLSIPVNDPWPQSVVAALLRSHLAVPLALPEPSESFEGEIEYLTDLAQQVGLAVPEAHLRSRDQVSAWIRTAYDMRTIRALERIQPAVTDIVEVTEATRRPAQLAAGEVVSFSNDGRLNFKGGRGQGARPHQVRILHRRNEDPEGWEAKTRDLAEQRARRTPPGAMTAIGHRELARFRVEREPGEAAFAAFQDALALATDEKPLQRVLERFPEILSEVVTHTQGAWVLPQSRLGGDYVPDFLVASETSAGVEWLLVELESPTHHLRIKDGSLGMGPRKGISQIETWRAWLKNNLHVARLPREEGGLGLPGISDDAHGLVLVGRADLSPQSDWARHREASGNDIHVRSYDWLIDAASRGRIAGFGALSREIRYSDDDVF